MKHLAALTLLAVLAVSYVPTSGLLAADWRAQEQGIYDLQIADSMGADFYPLKMGNTWTYSGPGNLKLVNKVVAHEKIGGVMCAKLETSMNGMAMANEHVGITRDGIYRFAFNGAAIDKPVLVLKLPARAGDTWKIESKIGNETVTGNLKTSEGFVQVPAGKFKALVASGKVEASGQTIEAANYFVRGVGVAKIKMEIAGTIIEINLEKFEPGK
jgi:hypothetical protein